MQTAKLFRNGNSQAVRIPKEFAFEGDEVRIERLGRAVLLLPKEPAWDDLWAACGMFSPDFLDQEREQPPVQEREGL